MSDLITQNCKPCEGGTSPLSPQQITTYLAQVHSRWQHQPRQTSDEGGQPDSIQAELQFNNYYETTAFVNAVVWIAHQQDHHPDISFGYKNVTIEYSTHAIDGLSENDFICAAKIDALL